MPICRRTIALLRVMMALLWMRAILLVRVVVALLLMALRRVWRSAGFGS